jgi:hypothetical protein
MNQQVFKGKKKAAVGGFRLLKKKVSRKCYSHDHISDVP